VEPDVNNISSRGYGAVSDERPEINLLAYNAWDKLGVIPSRREINPHHSCRSPLLNKQNVFLMKITMDNTFPS